MVKKTQINPRLPLVILSLVGCQPAFTVPQTSVLQSHAMEAESRGTELADEDEESLPENRNLLRALHFEVTCHRSGGQNPSSGSDSRASRAQASLSAREVNFRQPIVVGASRECVLEWSKETPQGEVIQAMFLHSVWSQSNQQIEVMQFPQSAQLNFRRDRWQIRLSHLLSESVLRMGRGVTHCLELTLGLSDHRQEQVKVYLRLERNES